MQPGRLAEWGRGWLYCWSAEKEKPAARAGCLYPYAVTGAWMEPLVLG